MIPTKEVVKELLTNVDNELVFEDENTLGYTNPCYGELICFEFEDNELVRILC